jgi:hypothetical protein
LTGFFWTTATQSVNFSFDRDGNPAEVAMENSMSDKPPEDLSVDQALENASKRFTSSGGADPPLAENPFFGPIAADSFRDTRMDKAVDFLLGRYCHGWEVMRDARASISGEMGMSWLANAILVLESTRHRHHLPNRRRLLAIVEAETTKEESK